MVYYLQHKHQEMDSYYSHRIWQMNKQVYIIIYIAIVNDSEFYQYRTNGLNGWQEC